MAFVPGNSPDQGANSDQDKEKNPLAEQAPITSAPAGGGSGNPSGQASSKGPSQPFTNLSSYLTANAPQVAQMGADIAGKLNTDYNATSGAIDSAKTSFTDRVNSGYTPYDQSLVDSFNTNPAAVAADPTKAASFKGMYNDRYTGPGNFQDAPEYADLSGKVQKSGAFANQVSTLPGLQSYLSSQSPTYTQGQATLDSALLQTNPDAVKTISDAAAPFKNLPGYLDQTVAAGNAASQNASTQAQQAKTAAQTAAGDFSTNFAKTNNEQFKGMADQATNYNLLMNSATAKINNGDYANLTPEEAKLVGYNPAVTNLIQKYPTIFQSQAELKPINFQNYFTSGDSARMPTAADAISPDELANYKALQQLTGSAPMLNFDAPEVGTEGSFHMPGKLPQYNNQQATAAIEEAYRPLYNTALNGGIQLSQDQINFMNTLSQVGGSPQPGPQPTTPQPAPGTSGDLGSGFHWDTATGTWQPTIPLSPPGGTPPSGGGGFHTF